MAEAISILVIDDEQVIRESVRKILSAEGFRVRTAADAESGLDILRGGEPEIALIDLKLPTLSGMDLLGLIRREFPQVPAIMTTGYSTLENAVASLQEGGFDFLPKPFAYEELLSAVQRAGRFVGLPESMRLPGLNAPAGRVYRLGMWVWARVDADDTALVGITDLFQRLVGGIIQVELSVPHGEVRQGSRLVELGAADQLRHPVWSALSGRLIERNLQVEADPSLLNRDPWGSGWLVRILPDNLRTELANLRPV
jgi:CheY-like chemotaxis protein/glycine cleavage system H lipoate-binding protein